MLRKTISLPVGDDEFEIDVDFRVLEIIERVYDMRAEYVAGLLEVDHRIRRSQVAEVILGWLSQRSDALVGRRRLDLLEEITTASEAVLRRYVGAIQGAILFSLKQLSDEDLEKLARGEDLAPTEQGDDAEKKTDDDSPPGP